MEENTNQNINKPTKPSGTQIKPGGTQIKPGGTQIKPGGAKAKPTQTVNKPTGTNGVTGATKTPQSQPKQTQVQNQSVNIEKELEKTEQPRPQNTERTVKTHTESNVEYVNTTSQEQPAEANKKSKKAKESKQPKPAKEKPVKDKKPAKEKPAKEKKPKMTKEEKKAYLATLTPEQLKEKKKQDLLGILKPVGIVVIIIIVLVVISKILGSGSDQHLTYADPMPSLEEQQASLKVKQVTYDGVTTTVAKEDTMVSANVSTEDIWEFTDNSKMITAGTTITFPVSVNTKLEGDAQYTDYYSFITFTVNNVTLGYDNVINSILAYNNTGTSVLNIGTKDDFYENNADNEIAMFDISMTIPSDFPTQDTKSGRIFIEPNADLVLKGSDDEASIITNKYVYAVPTLSNISDDVSELYAGNTYHFKWIAIVPNDITGDMYNMTLTLTQKDDEMVYEVQGMDIADSSTVNMTATKNGTESASETEVAESVETEKEAVTTESK
jgi:hypothetical protein